MATDPRQTAFRWLETHLKADPVLRRLVKSWQTWDGRVRSSTELTALPEASVRLTPIFDPETPESTSATRGKVIYSSPVTVRIETRQSGQVWDDAIEIWNAIELALDRGNQAFVRKARVAGVSWWEWVQPGANAGDNTVSLGLLRLIVYIER